MELFVKTSIVTLLVQVIRAQPALWGLGALGSLGEESMAGLSGFNALTSGISNGAVGTGACPYQAHPDKFKFTQMVNNRLMTQQCAPGTMFVLSKCSCDNIPSGGAGGALQGSNPRLDAALGGGGINSNLLNALISQLQGAGSSQLSGSGGSNPRLSAPPPVNIPPSISNKITSGIRPRVSSGIRPDQGFGKSQQSTSTVIQYKPTSSPGLTSRDNPAISPDVLPPEIMQVLKGSQGPNALNRGMKSPPPTVPTPTPNNRKSTSQPTRGARVDMSALANSGMPPEVLKMLQRSMAPPPSGSNRRTNQKRPTSSRAVSSTSRAVQSPARAVQSSTRAVPTPTRASPSLTRASGAKSQSSRHSNINRATGPRQDPLAALLASIQQTRGQSTQRQSSVASQRSAVAQGNPLAAMLAGLGGGGGSRGNTGMSGDPTAALLAGLSGNNQLAALLGSNPRSDSPSAPGGPLDLTSLTGNVNVATLLGETPGPGLAQNVDLTALFNAQGRLGAGGGAAALAGLNNINVLRLQELDRQGVIDISDLTPAGLAAANAHFG